MVDITAKICYNIYVKKGCDQRKVKEFWNCGEMSVGNYYVKR